MVKGAMFQKERPSELQGPRTPVPLPLFRRGLRRALDLPDSPSAEVGRELV